MLYAFGLHLAAGGVIGSVFRARILLVSVGFVVLEAATIAPVQGSVVGLWLLTSLVALQLGYLVGAFGRGVLEYAANARVRPRHLP